MFTPTELLKQYVKEAFAREDVPASDLRIKTWHDYRRKLARNAFGVLRTASGGGTFVLKDAMQSLNAEAVDRSIQWFSDFDVWQRTTFVEELRKAVQLLSEGQALAMQGLGRRLASILERAVENSLPSTFGALAAEVTIVQALVSSLKEATDASIKRVLNLQLNRNREFLDALARFIDGLQQGQAAEVEEQDGFCRNFYLRRFEVSSSSLSNRASGGRATMAINCKGAHFPPDIILMGIRWYVAYPLSPRHVEELMEERGVEVDHSTIHRPSPSVR